MSHIYKVDKLEAPIKYWKNHFYNPILDSIIIDLKPRFFEKRKTLANSTKYF